MIVFPTSACERRLKAYARSANTLHLYSNDVRPTPDSAIDAFVETTRNIGYAPIRLTKAGWQVRPADDGVSAVAISAPATFVFTGGDADVYGWYVVADDGELMASEIFSEPFKIRRAGDKLEIVVVLESSPKKLADDGT